MYFPIIAMLTWNTFLITEEKEEQKELKVKLKES